MLTQSRGSSGTGLTPSPRARHSGLDRRFCFLFPSASEILGGEKNQGYETYGGPSLQVENF